MQARRSLSPQQKGCPPLRSSFSRLPTHQVMRIKLVVFGALLVAILSLAGCFDGRRDYGGYGYPSYFGYGGFGGERFRGFHDGFHGDRFHGGGFYGDRFKGGEFDGDRFHGGEFHGDGFHGGGFHGGGFHGGGFHGGGHR